MTPEAAIEHDIQILRQLRRWQVDRMFDGPPEREEIENARAQLSTLSKMIGALKYERRLLRFRVRL
jgi:hypothetical protein